MLVAVKISSRARDPRPIRGISYESSESLGVVVVVVKVETIALEERALSLSLK